MIVSGRRFKPDWFHRFERRTPPARYVVVGYPTGWNLCECCEIEHRIWIVSDAVWQRMPRRWRYRRICTRCYRAVTGKRRR